LMPPSSPDTSRAGGLPSPPGTHLANWYAKKLGIPVAMVNKVGSASPPPPNEMNAFFPGRSAIVDSDGTVKRLMDDKEGIAVADVLLDPARKRSPEDPPVCTGGGTSSLTSGAPAHARADAPSQCPGSGSYADKPLSSRHC